MAGWTNLFWTNPEFVRHRRAELRPVRAITVAAVVAVLCALIGLACWSSEESARVVAGSNQDLARQTWLVFYRCLVGLQGLVMTFWALFSCAQSVSGERDLKTWDFQRRFWLANFWVSRCSCISPCYARRP
jgi:protein-S-isoprenylcysteine O-methyltransferase Ste14